MFFPWGPCVVLSGWRRCCHSCLDEKQENHSFFLFPNSPHPNLLILPAPLILVSSCIIFSHVLTLKPNPHVQDILQSWFHLCCCVRPHPLICRSFTLHLQKLFERRSWWSDEDAYWKWSKAAGDAADTSHHRDTYCPPLQLKAAQTCKHQHGCSYPLLRS